jgi:hypothetical protein
MLPALHGRRDAGDLRPDHEGLRAGAPVLGGGEVIAAEVKEVVDMVVGREEPLHLAGRFVALHLPLSCRVGSAPARRARRRSGRPPATASASHRRW